MEKIKGVLIKNGRVCYGGGERMVNVEIDVAMYYRMFGYVHIRGGTITVLSIEPKFDDDPTVHKFYYKHRGVYDDWVNNLKLGEFIDKLN